jgi:hypothetical protein
MASGSDEAFDWSHLVKETLRLEGIGSPRAEQIQEREQRRLTVAMVARQGANVDTAVADPTACVNYLKGERAGVRGRLLLRRRDDLAGGGAYRGGLRRRRATMAATRPAWPT